MKRLTLKDDEYWVKSDNQNKAIQKLGQLEDIEDELGIDLLTFVKAAKNGIYIIHEQWTDRKGYHKVITYINYPQYNILRKTFCTFFHFKDYGKTWALTKEELEK